MKEKQNKRVGGRPEINPLKQGGASKLYLLAFQGGRIPDIIKDTTMSPNYAHKIYNLYKKFFTITSLKLTEKGETRFKYEISSDSERFLEELIKELKEKNQTLESYEENILRGFLGSKFRKLVKQFITANIKLFQGDVNAYLELSNLLYIVAAVRVMIGEQVETSKIKNSLKDDCATNIFGKYAHSSEFTDLMLELRKELPVSLAEKIVLAFIGSSHLHVLFILCTSVREKRDKK